MSNKHGEFLYVGCACQGVTSHRSVRTKTLEVQDPDMAWHWSAFQGSSHRADPMRFTGGIKGSPLVYGATM